MRLTDNVQFFFLKTDNVKLGKYYQRESSNFKDNNHGYNIILCNMKLIQTIELCLLYKLKQLLMDIPSGCPHQTYGACA